MYGTIVKFYSGILSLLNMQPDSYIDLEGISLLGDEGEEPFIFLRGNGALVTVLEIKGNYFYLETEEFEEYFKNLEEIFEHLASSKGHKIQFVYKRDRESVDALIDIIFKPTYDNMKLSGKDFKWLLDAKREIIKKTAVNEKMYLVIETNSAWLSKEMGKYIQKEMMEVNKGVPNYKGSLKLFETSMTLYDKHVSAMKGVISSCRRVGLYLEKLSCKEALKEIRFDLEPGYCGIGWEARLPTLSKPVFNVPNKNESYGFSDILYPGIAKQIIASGFEVTENDDVIRYGQRYYTSVIVTLAQESPEMLNMLIARSMSFDIPFQISFRMSNENSMSFFFYSMLSSLMASFSTKNKQLLYAKKSMDEFIEKGGKATNLSIVVTTYGHSVEHAKENVRKLIQLLHGWGNTESSDNVGSAYLGVISSFPALSPTDPAPKTWLPLFNALYMSPLYKVSSPWKTGNMLFQSADGRIMPFQPGSSLQSHWSTIGFAPPGQGKSVLLNSLLLSFIVGQRELPYLGIIDIGPSSKGLVDLIYYSLPEYQRHEVSYMAVENREEYSINIFDTMLGLEKPIPAHKSSIESFLISLCTPEGSETPAEGVPELISSLIDLAYKRFSRRSREAKIYERGVDDEIDEFLDKHYPDQVFNDATWWDITDFLFEQGQIVYSNKAHKYAMPTIMDLIPILSEQGVKRTFDGKSINGQPLTEYVSEFLSSAINKYPLMANTSKIDLGNAKVMVFDLAQVAPSGGAAARKQSSIMFSLFRHVITYYFYVNKTVFSASSMNEAERKYLEFHQKEADKRIALPKIFSMDEFHRTQGIKAFRDIVERDIREGRKFNVQIYLFSQDPGDFSEVMQNFSTTKFILGAGGEDNLRKIKESFGVSDKAIKMIRNIPPPSPVDGARLYVKATTAYGEIEMYVKNMLSPIEQWALETNATNRALRAWFYERIGIKRTLLILAKEFPSGSAVQFIEQEKERLASLNIETDVFEYVGNKILEKWENRDEVN